MVLFNNYEVGSTLDFCVFLLNNSVQSENKYRMTTNDLSILKKWLRNITHFVSSGSKKTRSSIFGAFMLKSESLQPAQFQAVGHSHVPVLPLWHPAGLGTRRGARSRKRSRPRSQWDKRFPRARDPGPRRRGPGRTRMPVGRYDGERELSGS